MGAVRVDRFALRLLAPASLREQAGAMRRQAESVFVPALLQALSQRLEQLYGPDAVLRIPSLRLKLRLPAPGLVEGGWAERVSEDLAQQIGAWVAREPVGGRADGSVAPACLFRDAAHLQVARLVAAARRVPGPQGEVEDFAAVWAEIGASTPDVRDAVLQRLAEEPGRDAVLARWPLAQLQQVLRWLPAAAPAGWREALREEARAREQVNDAARETRAREPAAAASFERPQDSDTEVRAEDAHGDEALPPITGQAPRGRSAPSPASAPPAQPVAPKKEEAHRARTATAPPATQAAAAVSRRVEVAHASPSARDAPGRRPAPATPGTPPRPLAARDTDGAPSFDTIAQDLARWPSAWCGLPGLLNISLRLELPERLWQVGIPEGDALAALLARIAGDEDAPALRLPSPAFPHAPAPLPPVPAWAREELAAGVAQAALRWPAVRAHQAAVRARVDELQAWHARGTAFDLVAWAAAWHLAIAEALLQQRLAPADLAARFGGAGVVTSEGDTLRIVQPLEAIDIDVRRAGLDADPGWLPWLGRRLVFVFEGREPLAP